MTFGEWMRQTREQLEWSQDDLAWAAAVPVHVIPSIESGRIRKPDRITRESIERALKARQDEMAWRTQHPDAAIPETTVREYLSRGDFDRDARLLALQGWIVASSTERKEGHGIFGSRSVYTVTYQRTHATPPSRATPP